MARNNRRARKTSLSVVKATTTSTVATPASYDDKTVADAIGAALGAQGRIELRCKEHELSDFLWQFAVSPSVLSECKSGRTETEVAALVSSFMSGRRDFEALISCGLLTEKLRGLSAIGIFEAISHVHEPTRLAMAA